MPPSTKKRNYEHNQTPYQKDVSKVTQLVGQLSMQQGTTPQVFQGFAPVVSPQAAKTSSKKPVSCAEYLKPKYLNLMPYMYQASELATKGIPETYLTEVKIHPVIQELYKVNAEEAKQNSIQTLIKKYLGKKEFETFKPQLEHFFNAVTIHSKEAFLKTATKGFDWVRPRLEPYEKSWVLMTENYVSNVTRAGILKASQSIPFKSSEWVGKMFLATLDKNHTSQCVVDSTNVRDVMTEPERTCYVLFDDGAYSGSQKGLILSSFIATVLPVRQQTTLYLVIPYYTVYALNRFRMNVNGGIQSLSRAKILVECAYEIQDTEACERYVLTTKINDIEHRMEIVIWTGGERMEESESIIGRGEGDPTTKLLFLSKMKGVDSLGATMTLFEHKVPDFLSLNAAFGNAFKDKKVMEAHYEYNPPYKVKPLPTPSKAGGGCGCGRSGGAKRKNYALEGSRTAATMGSGKMSSPSGETGAVSKRRNK